MRPAGLVGGDKDKIFWEVGGSGKRAGAKDDAAAPSAAAAAEEEG